MKTWKSLKRELLESKNVATEYKRLEPRYQMVSQLIEARRKKRFTQEHLAKLVGTKQSSIARLESGETNPTLEFIEKLVHALDSKIVIQIG